MGGLKATHEFLQQKDTSKAVEWKAYSGPATLGVGRTDLAVPVLGVGLADGSLFWPAPVHPTPRNRGVDPLLARVDHAVMEPLNPSPKTPPQGADLEARVQAWIQLRDQMRHVEAQLEYVRLMLKMGVRPGSSR